MAVVYQLKFWHLSPAGLHEALSLTLPSFLTAFSLVSPTYLYSLSRHKTVSLLTNSILSIQRGGPHHCCYGRLRSQRSVSWRLYGNLSLFPPVDLISFLMPSRKQIPPFLAKGFTSYQHQKEVEGTWAFGRCEQMWGAGPGVFISNHRTFPNGVHVSQRGRHGFEPVT